MDMTNKYTALGSNIFGFEIFEEVFKVINERKGTVSDPSFDFGVDSAEAAVRRLREEYYNAIQAGDIYTHENEK